MSAQRGEVDARSAAGEGLPSPSHPDPTPLSCGPHPPVLRTSSPVHRPPTRHVPRACPHATGPAHAMSGMPASIAPDRPMYGHGDRTLHLIGGHPGVAHGTGRAPRPGDAYHLMPSGSDLGRTAI